MFKNICSKLLDESTQLYLIDLNNEIIYLVDEDFVESYDYCLPKGENLSKWCAEQLKVCVHEEDRNAFINLLNPYELLKEMNKNDMDFSKFSLYFRNCEEEWRHISIQKFEDYFAILKIEKVEISNLAAKIISTSRRQVPIGARIKGVKDFKELEKDLKKFPPASIGIVYLKSKNKEVLCKSKDILAEIFKPENCYGLNKEVIIAIMTDESSKKFQHGIVNLYSHIDNKLQDDLDIGSYWTCDEDEEDPYIILDKTLRKITDN